MTKYKLGRICDVSSSKRIFAKEYVSSGVPFYRGKEIIQLKNNKPLSEPLYISHEKYEEIKNKFGVPQIGDILITSVGTIGESYQIKSSEPFYFKDGNVTRLSNFNLEEVNPKYLYYWINSSDFMKQVDNILIGTTQKALTIENLKNLEIDLPDLSTQKKIANLLSSLDDKIEINNKINQELEELGQALYTKWFVNFDFPNKDGKPYKSSGGEMIESELGMIPRGWKVKSLDELASIVTGKQNANIKTDNGEFEFFTCSKESFKTNQYSFDTKAILVAGNGEFYTQWYEGKFEVYQRTYVIEPKIKELFFPIYLNIKNKIPYITQDSRGSVIKFITIGHLNEIKVAVPENIDVSIFDSVYNKLMQLKNENKKLEELRDFLIPQLMSGNLEVKDLEEKL